MSRTIVIVLAVVGLGGLAYWWMRRQQAAAQDTGSANADPCGGGGVFDTIGGFVRDHVNRKNAVAPYVAQAYAKIPAAQAAPLTQLAGKLDASAYVENYVGSKVGNALCSMSFPSITQIGSDASKAVQKIGTTSTTFGTDQLKAGTISPVKDLYGAGQSLARGDVTGAAKSVGKSIVGGPVAAYNSTKNFVTSLF